MSSSRIADRLSAARRTKLVGRAAELALFRDALTAPGPLPFFVLYVFGPGGVGKTTLLSAFAGAAHDAAVPVVLLDARNIEPTPDAFLSALRQTLIAALGTAPLTDAAAAGNDPLALLGNKRRVLLVDTYENLEPLDDYLRDTFLPRLSDDTLVVLAGRVPPSAGWRGDLGWQNMVRSTSLRNLAPAESRAFLEQRAVPAAQHPAVLDFTHGHPLALSLVADLFEQRGTPDDAAAAPVADLRAFVPQAAPDVIQTLVERFVRDVPGPAHRAALEVCALVRLTTEDLLARMLREADEPGLLAVVPDQAHALFDWLCHLGFIERGWRGLFPHDLAREALLADLRWRNPERYALLHARARDFYSGRHKETTGAEQQRVLFDFMFLHRDSQVVRSAFAWHDNAGLVTDETLRATDTNALAAMTARHEGDESARLLRFWLGRQPQNALVFRDTSGGDEPAGFALLLSLSEAEAGERDADPATRAAWNYLQKHASPLRPGEAATHFRFWMARETYQAVSPVQSLVIVNIVRRCLTISGLAYTFFPVADPDLWAPLFAYAEMRRIPEADFCVDNKSYGVFGNDWRVLSPPDWLALLARKETAGDEGAVPAAAPAAPRGDTLLVLSEPEFAAAVRDVLRHFSQPPLLRTSPLLRSRIVAARVASPGAGTEERVAALRNVFREGAEALQTSPRTAKGYHAVRLTYLEPASSQEQAADLLDLPFSTYRRHLAAGVAEITRRSWLQEIGALSSGGSGGEK